MKASRDRDNNKWEPPRSLYGIGGRRDGDNVWWGIGIKEEERMHHKKITGSPNTMLPRKLDWNRILTPIIHWLFRTWMKEVVEKCK